MIDDIFWKNKTILAQQHTIIELKGKLDSGVGVVGVLGDSLITSVFTNTYADSGVSIQLQDSVVLEKISSIGKWVGYNYPEFTLGLKLTNTIGRNTNGLHFGAVEINSPLISSLDVVTIFDESYYKLPKEDGQKEKLPSSFAIGNSTSSSFSSFGFLVVLSRWEIGVNYLTFIQSDRSFKWHERLQANVYYFIL